MKEPIRYALSDPVENWLTDLLCLDTTEPFELKDPNPILENCSIYIVNRDVLFNYHPYSNQFLRQLMSLFVSSDYKYTPDDL